jgi:hypothetical protein
MGIIVTSSLLKLLSVPAAFGCLPCLGEIGAPLCQKKSIASIVPHGADSFSFQKESSQFLPIAVIR